MTNFLLFKINAVVAVCQYIKNFSVNFKSLKFHVWNPFRISVLKPSRWIENIGPRQVRFLRLLILLLPQSHT